MRKYDLVIVGAGAAGKAAAVKADSLGADVALVEAGPVGGTSVNLGCVATKNLLRAGELDHRARSDRHLDFKEGHGLEFEPTIAATKLMIEKFRLRHYEEKLAALRNVVIVRGRAKFISSHEISVDDQVLYGTKIIIATGSLPFIQPDKGLEDIDCLTNRNFLELHEAPRSLIILGAGPLGLEFAQLFAHFGTEVTVVQRSNAVLSGCEPEVGEAARRYLEEDGIRIWLNEPLVGARWRGSRREILTDRDGKRTTHTADEVLIATGRVANTGGFGLERTGLALDDRGAIIVDDELLTSVPNIYAAGDVRGGLMLENAAEKEGRVAAQNALSPRKREIDYEAIPSCVFIHPEVAQVGMVEREARRRRHDAQAHIVEFSAVPRAAIIGESRGLIKLVADTKTRRILGCGLIAPGAAEIIHEVVLAIKYRLTLDDMAEIEYVYPSLSASIGMAARKFAAAAPAQHRERPAA